VFVPRQEAYFEAIKPLMALWLECAASATLNLAPSASRRVWFILDELADLPRVENLPRLLPEGRKFGASVVITFQAIGQMHHRYGQNQAEAMLAMCNTKLFMQMPDHQTRQWASDQIGAQEVEIQTVSDSFDRKTGAPARTLSTTRQTRPAILESDLRLPPHVGYLLLPDGYPVAGIKLGDAHIHARGPARQSRHLPISVEETLWSRLAATPREPGVKAPSSPLAAGPV
jgi:type IV secretory pathway TraG/TraD family ATPase VirD4